MSAPNASDQDALGADRIASLFWMGLVENNYSSYFDTQILVILEIANRRPLSCTAAFIQMCIKRGPARLHLTSKVSFEENNWSFLLKLRF